MALSTQEQEKLRELKARGFTFEQAMSEIGGARIGSPSTITHLTDRQEVKQPSYIDNAIDSLAQVGSESESGIKSGQQRANESLAKGDVLGTIRGATEATAAGFSTIPKGAMALAPEPVKKGIEYVGEKVGNAFKSLTDWIGSNKSLQEFTQKHPEATKAIMDVAGTLSAGGEIAGTILTVDGAAKTLQKGVNGAKTLKQGLSNTIDKAAEKYATTPKELTDKLGIKYQGGDTASSIMDRVARVNPKDAQEFENLSGGETIGKYLARTGNTNAPDKLIQIEAQKFLDSRNSVDAAFAEMDADLGKYFADGTIDDAISALQEKAQSVSTKNVPAPFQSDLDSIVNAYTSNGGLNMEQINILKRLYERNVKLGYSKLLNPDAVARATNVDSALREFQFKVAAENGFKNVADLNKQTQLSRFIVDKLGAKLTGQSGLNAVSLTDWLVLSGANPQALAGFLTKKFFGSKEIQAKIASMLNKPEDAIIKPDYAQSIPIQDGTMTR